MEGTVSAGVRLDGLVHVIGVEPEFSAGPAEVRGHVLLQGVLPTRHGFPTLPPFLLDQEKIGDLRPQLLMLN